MMESNKIKIAFLVLFMSVNNVLAQDGKALLRKAFATMDNMADRVDQDHILSLEYEMKITSQPYECASSTTNRNKVKMVADGHRSYFSTGQMEIYQDQQNTVVIVPNDKEIYIKQTEEEAYKKRMLGNLEVLQNSLLQNSELISSTSSINPKGKKVQVIKLSPSGKKVNQQPIEYLTYTIDQVTNQFTKIEVKYKQGNNISAMEISFSKMQLISEASQLKKIPIAQVMKNNHPLEQYEAYIINDIRPKK